MCRLSLLPSPSTAPDGTADTLGTGVLCTQNKRIVVRMSREVAVHVVVNFT